MSNQPFVESINIRVMDCDSVLKLKTPVVPPILSEPLGVTVTALESQVFA